MNDIDNVTADLIRVGTELIEAEADVAFLTRLNEASKRVEVLTAEQARLADKLAGLVKTQEDAATASRFAGLSNLSVLDLTPEKSVMHSHFRITYTSPTWNGYQTYPKVHTVEGFGALDGRVFDYLIEKHPYMIPAKIAALAVDPVEAFEVYAVGLRRGFLNSAGLTGA